MKKKVNIVLLLVVIGLWGTVVYRYVKRFFYQSNDVLNQTSIANRKINKIVAKDSFELPTITRDPFLNKNTVVKTTLVHKQVLKNRQPITKPSVPKQMAKNAQPMPSIKYYGYIKSTGAVGELFLLRVNGKLLKIKLNQEIENLKVTQLKNDSIKIVYNKKEIKWFTK